MVRARVTTEKCRHGMGLRFLLKLVCHNPGARYFVALWPVFCRQFFFFFFFIICESSFNDFC